MAVIEKFLGVRVTIPENLAYLPQQGLWAKAQQERIVFGFTEPALTLSGGLNRLDWLVEQAQVVASGETIVFAMTERIVYLDASAKGVVQFNDSLKEAPVLAQKDPYGQGWLFKLLPSDGVDQLMEMFVKARHYIQRLRNSEGFRNPQGLKGGGPCACKALYASIRGLKEGQ